MRVWVNHSCRGYPSRDQVLHALPREAFALLTSPPQCPEPRSIDLRAKRVQRASVAGDSVVVEMPLHHGSQPPPLCRDRPMPSPHQDLADLFDLHPQSFRDGLAPQRETPVWSLGADVRKSEEVEGLRLPLAPLFAVVDGKAPELDQSGLLLVEF